MKSPESLIEIGASSGDIRLAETIEILSTMKIPVKIDRLTTIGELMETEKGAAMIAGMMGGAAGGQEKSDQSSQAGSAGDAAGEKAQEQDTEEMDDAMGAGAERMRRQMMMDMPLSSLVSYGVMNDDQLDGLIMQLNA